MSEHYDPFPTRPCEPWCTQKGRGHATDHPVDRFCLSDQTLVTVSSLDPIRWDSGAYTYDAIEVYARRNAGDTTVPGVHINDEVNRYALDLTTAEARQLRDALAHAIALAEQTPEVPA